MSSRALLLTIPLLAGCFGSNPIEGIWVFYVSPDASIDASASCDENFTNAECPASTGGTDSPWTITTDLEQDEDSFVGQVVGIGGGQALLFAGDLVLDGEKNDEGLWVFTYSNFTDASTSRGHEAGYRYTENSYSSATLRLVLDSSFGTFDGKMAGESVADREWTESDDWDVSEVGIWEGDIPAGNHLTGEAYNEYNGDDCQGDTCTLAISEESTVSTPIRGELTDLRDPSDFDALEGYGDYDWN